MKYRIKQLINKEGHQTFYPQRKRFYNLFWSNFPTPSKYGTLGQAEMVIANEKNKKTEFKDSEIIIHKIK